MIRQFHQPSSIEDALAIKKSHGDAITWFSGGAYLNRIDYRDLYDEVICLEHLQMSGIRVVGGNLEIGSTSTLQEVLDHESTPKALKQVIRQASPRTIRNLATIGGDVAMGGRITRLTPCLTALGTKLIINQAEVPIEHYPGQQRQDLIMSLIIPLKNRPCSTLQVSHQASADPLCSIAVSMDPPTDGRISNLIIAIGTVESTCRRLTELEEKLRSDKEIDVISIRSAVSDSLSIEADLSGSATYRKYVTGQAVADCLMSCLEGVA